MHCASKKFAKFLSAPTILMQNIIQSKQPFAYMHYVNHIRNDDILNTAKLHMGRKLISFTASLDLHLFLKKSSSFSKYSRRFINGMNIFKYNSFVVVCSLQTRNSNPPEAPR